MLRALLERGIVPDLVLGTSIGAINGGGSPLRRLGTLARSRTHLHDLSPLRGLLSESLPVERIEDLAVPFGCVAACIETADRCLR